MSDAGRTDTVAPAGSFVAASRIQSKTCRKNAARLLKRGLGRIELAAEDAEQEASGDGGADNTGHVGAHGVHQQEVGGVGLLAFLVGHTGSHGHGGHAGGADQGVDGALGGPAHHIAAQQAAGGGEEDPVKNLLTISSSSLRRERRRSWGVVAGVLTFVLIIGLLVGYNLLYVTETRQGSIVLKETVNGTDYLYMEEKGHLLQLRCGKNVDFDAIALDDGYCPLIYEVELRWNRLTYKGTATSCTTAGTISLGSPMDMDPYWQETTLFGSAVLYATDDYYPDPYAELAGRGFLCDFYVKEMGIPSTSQILLLVEDCIGGTVADVDSDGENEVVIRTRWPEKPYSVYDYVDGEIVTIWPDTLPEEILESLVQF